MRTINFNTKRGQSIVNRYNAIGRNCLMDCYANPSQAKRIAWIACLELMDAENGWGMKIISYNTKQFTAAWMTDWGLRVETRDNSYVITDLPF